MTIELDPQPTSNSLESTACDIRMTGVGFRYDSAPALHDVDVHVSAGEFFTLLGPSGSGKSTLLRIVAGLLSPSQGTVRFDGRDVTNIPVQKRDIGFVFQNYALFPHLTVRENVEFPLRLRKEPKALRLKRVGEVLDLVSLGDLGDRYPGQLSGGQQQRVALARALVHRPRVLLLDEPLGALDRRLRQTLGREVRRIQKEFNTTAIYVTHDQEEAFILSDRIGVMKDGSIQQIGKPAAIYSQPANQFVAEFLGEVNILSGIVSSVQGSNAIVSLAGANIRCEVADRADVGGTMLVAIRPEDIIVGAASSEMTMGGDYLGSATVTDCYFLGAFVRMHLTLQDGQKLLADVDAAMTTASVGDHIPVHVRAGRPRLIAV